MSGFLKSILAPDSEREQSTLYVMTRKEIEEMTEHQKTNWNRDPSKHVILFDKKDTGPAQHAGLNVDGYCSGLPELQAMIGQLKELPGRISISANLPAADYARVKLLEQCLEMTDEATDVQMHGSMQDIAKWSRRGAVR